MKSFILRSFCFVFPFFILYGITYLFCSYQVFPDLLRLGYLPNFGNKELLDDYEFFRNNEINLLSETNLKKFQLMTIGDSFSDQGASGYSNFLAQKFSLLHINRFSLMPKATHKFSSIQALIDLYNGDFFDNYQIDYVILECVERHFIDISENIDWDTKVTLQEIDSLIQIQRQYIPVQEKKQISTAFSKPIFFSRTTLEFPLYALPRYLFTENYLSHQTYNATLNTNSLFSNVMDKLLFYYFDLENLPKNNDFNNVRQLNDILNTLTQKLKEKNIQLIVLPAPDKYDLYYDFILDKTNFPKPLFFEHWRILDKDYLFIDTKQILSAELENQTDLYFFGDTHWSPKAAKLIAEYIERVVDIKR